MKDLLYRAEFKDDFLNYLDLNEYKRALQDGSVGKLFGTSSLEIKKPEDTNYTMISKHEVLADPSTSYTFGESSKGTVKVKYVDENNKEISSLETIAENQPWYNKYEIPKKDIPGYEYISASQPLVDLIMSGEKVVTLTYRSVEKTREIPFNTIYQEDPTKDKGYKETIVKGATGIEGYKDSDSKYKRIIKEKTDEIVKVGTKSTTVTEKLLSPVRYEKDSSREKGQENITVKGKDGSKTTTTTYTVNAKTGEVVSNVGKPAVVNPTETVVKVAAKDKIVYSKDGNNVIKETTTYNVNSKTGEITEKTTREVFKENGAKDKVSTEKLPSLVRYEKDGSREKGQENITIKGKDGSKTTTTTYTVNDKTGEVVPNVGKPVVVEPTETVVKVAAKDKIVYSKEGNNVVKETTTYNVNPKTGEITEKTTREVFKENGAKDKVSVEKLPSPVRYEKDGSREKGQENITIKGKDGSKTTTTTYTVNDKTGEVVENVGKPVVVNPTETVVKVATKDKVVVEKLPSPVRYEKDNSREKGQENITVKGKDGSKTTTTTYTVNPKTGEVVPNVGKSVVVESTETVVKVAAKDKVEVVNKKDGETIRITTSYEVNPKTGEIKEVKKEDLLSKKGIPEVSEETIEFKGGVNPTESIVREDLPELKVALIKDGDGNVLEVIKEDEKPKDIQGYKNTGKTEVDKDGYKVYIYEKEEPKVDKNTPTESANKVVDKKEEVNKEVINKKEELPKTSSVSMLGMFGLVGAFGMRKKRKKDR